jgi:hypothetical protein
MLPGRTGHPLSGRRQAILRPAGTHNHRNAYGLESQSGKRKTAARDDLLSHTSDSAVLARTPATENMRPVRLHSNLAARFADSQVCDWHYRYPPRQRRYRRNPRGRPARGRLDSGSPLVDSREPGRRARPRLSSAPAPPARVEVSLHVSCRPIAVTLAVYFIALRRRCVSRPSNQRATPVEAGLPSFTP